MEKVDSRKSLGLEGCRVRWMVGEKRIKRREI